jgi:DNA-binding response OmpR family regulator
MTAPSRDRILIVESDPTIGNVIANQALQACGYQTFVVGDASTAIGRIAQVMPDLIISNLDLPGLSGKDLAVALSAQGISIPVIIIAKKGEEANIVHAFRVGAVDYLLWPCREAEIVNTVERVLRQVHERREREQLQRQLERTNLELQQRVRELTTIFAIGKAVTSITNQALLFERLLEGAIKLTQAETGWFLVREGSGKTFRLAAQHNLPASLAEKLHQAWDDGLSSLIAMSGETLSIHGEPLRRYKISDLGQSALIVPIKARKQVMGLLVMMHKQPVQFTPSEQHLLEAMADFASISMVNAQLIHAVEERAQKLESAADAARTAGKVNREILEKTKEELRSAVELAGENLKRLGNEPNTRWYATNRLYFINVLDQLEKLRQITEAIVPLQELKAADQLAASTNLAEIVRKTASAFQPLARQNNLTLSVEIASDPVQSKVDAGQMTQVLNGLLSNAIRSCKPGCKVILHLEKNPDGAAHIILSSSAGSFDEQKINQAFDLPEGVQQDPRSQKFGGIGIGLNLIKEVITGQQGKIWIESQTGQGSQFHITLPGPKTS